MKKSHECEVATHIDPESCGAVRKSGETPRAGTGISHVRPGTQLAWDASGSLRTHADDERTWEVGQPYSTWEVPEQGRTTGGGGDGGKRTGQREPAPAKRVPDTEPERRAQCGGAWTHPLLWGAHEHPGADALSLPSRLALATRPVAAQPEWPRPLGPHAASRQPLVATAYRLPSVSSLFWRAISGGNCRGPQRISHHR